MIGLARRTGRVAGKLVATTALTLAILLGAQAAAHAYVKRPEGGYGYTTMTYCNKATHEITLQVSITADHGNFIQTVSHEQWYWTGYQWITSMRYRQINLRDPYERTGSSTYWNFTTPPLPGPKWHYFYNNYRWFYGGKWNPLGEQNPFWC